MDLDGPDIELILAGDEQGYANILARYRNYVFTVCKRILIQNELAEEAAQDCFVKAFKRIRTFRGESKFSTWLYKIAWTTSISLKRTEKRHLERVEWTESLDSRTQSPEGYNNLVNKDMALIVEQAMWQLSPEERLALTLFYWQDQSLNEIASIISESSNTVKVRIFRARKKLGAIIEQLSTEEVKEWT
jgi:RNA polymerase sigma factor (sigma-70 family)